MPNGYNGKILHVNLTTGKLTVENPSERFYRKYLGGSAMGMHYILKQMKPATDPLGPDNVLTMMLSDKMGVQVAQAGESQRAPEVEEMRAQVRESLKKKTEDEAGAVSAPDAPEPQPKK